MQLHQFRDYQSLNLYATITITITTISMTSLFRFLFCCLWGWSTLTRPLRRLGQSNLRLRP